MLAFALQAQDRCSGSDKGYEGLSGWEMDIWREKLCLQRNRNFIEKLYSCITQKKQSKSLCFFCGHLNDTMSIRLDLAGFETVLITNRQEPDIHPLSQHTAFYKSGGIYRIPL